MTKHDSFVLLRDDSEDRTTVFATPLSVITARTAADFWPALTALEAAHVQGHWLAGFVAYEAGHLFEEKLAPYAVDGRRTPLLSFGVFEAPAVDHPLAAPRRRVENEPFITQARATWDFPHYHERFARLHAHLRQGDCYQANLTMPVTARWSGDPLDAFWHLIARQPVKYGAFVKLDGPMLLSRSPELFFKVDGDGWIETRPMKGTAARGATPVEDAEIIDRMRNDPKSQAENRMIVDLLRNDISRITEVGTLSVPRLFDIETYPTVHQMVSTVRARLSPQIGIADIFSALFPCGSVTGAPKMRAMEILHDLEAGPRDAYCGAIGWIAPDRTMQFNVAIRTLSLFADGEAVFNVGSGIVFDSQAEDEYRECLLKARFVLDDAWAG